MLWEKRQVLWGCIISHSHLAEGQGRRPQGGDIWTHVWRIGRVPDWGKGVWEDPDFWEKYGTLEVLRGPGSWSVKCRGRLVSNADREVNLSFILQGRVCHGKNLVFFLRAIGKSINSSKPGDNMIWFTFLRKSLWSLDNGLEQGNSAYSPWRGGGD